MTNVDLRDTLAQHALWLGARGGARAHLTRAELNRVVVLIARDNLQGAVLLLRGRRRELLITDRDIRRAMRRPVKTAKKGARR